MSSASITVSRSTESRPAVVPARSTGPARLPSEPSSTSTEDRPHPVTTSSTEANKPANRPDPSPSSFKSSTSAIGFQHLPSPAPIASSSVGIQNPSILSSSNSLVFPITVSAVPLTATSWVQVSSMSSSSNSAASQNGTTESSVDRSAMGLRISAGVIGAFFLIMFLLLCFSPRKLFKKKDRSSSAHPKAPLPGLGWNHRKSTATGSWDTWEKFDDEKTGDADAKEVLQNKRFSKRDSRRASRMVRSPESVYTVFDNKAGFYNHFPAPPMPALPAFPPDSHSRQPAYFQS